jgi:hypothetical protein
MDGPGSKNSIRGDNEMGDRTGDKKGFMFTMLVLGSVCGLIEVIVKGVLHQSGLHLSGLLAGLGCFLIGIGLAVYRSPSMIIGIGAIACLYKQLVVPIHGISFMCGANACLAVMLEYGSLAGLSAFTLKTMGRNAASRILTGGAGVFIGSMIYYFAGMRLNPCPYMLTFNVPGGFTAFIAREGLTCASFGAVLFPLGWSVGERFGEKLSVLIKGKTRPYYLKSAFSIVVCLAAAGIFVSMKG